MDALLKLLKTHGREPVEALARMLDRPVAEVQAALAEYERRGVIRGYQAVLNEEAVDPDQVLAMIEVKITPEREGGFNHLALRISRFPEVVASHLVSGQPDLLLIVQGRDLREVASFVSEKLAPIPGVTATSTSFIMKTYKSHGFLMESTDESERPQVS